ncbi:MAG: hypothetical protein ACK559_40820, partial [bacterium]
FQLSCSHTNSSSRIASVTALFPSQHLQHLREVIHRSRHTHALHLAAHTHCTRSSHGDRASSRR